MKTVYADVVLLVNFCADYILLYLCSRFFQFKVPFIKLFFASVFGAVYGLLSVVCMWLRFVFIPVAILMCHFAFGKRSYRVYLRITLMLFVFSIMLAGALELVGVQYVSNSNFVRGITLTALALFFVYLLCVCIKRLMYRYLNVKTVAAVIYVGNINFKAVLLADSGNLLTEPVSGKAVVVLDSRHRDVFASQTDHINLMRFKTVSGIGIIEIFSADRIIIGNTEIDAYVGFCINSFYKFDEYDGIVPAGILRSM